MRGPSAGPEPVNLQPGLTVLGARSPTIVITMENVNDAFYINDHLQFFRFISPPFIRSV